MTDRPLYSRADPARFPRRLPWDRDSLAEALPDFLARGLGCPPSAADHPLVEDLLDAGLTLRDMAENVDPLSALMIGTRGYEQQLAARSSSTRAYTSPDFAPALGNAIQRLVVQGYSAASTHLRITREILVRNFRPINFPVVSMRIDGADDGIVSSEHAEMQNTILNFRDGQSAEVESYARAFGITRRIFINDQINAIAAAVSQFGPFGARREARKVFGVLTSNLTLADGRAMFNATDANDITGALAEDSLGQAFAALRRQKTIAGSETGHAPRFLLVPAEDEVSSLKLVRSLTVGEQAPVEVLADVAIPSGSWFVLASPEVAAVVGFLKLRDQRSTIRIERRNPGAFDDAVYQFLHDFGTVALGRVGAVRGQA